MKFKLEKIRSDASFREFFRLHKGEKTSVIVKARKEKFKNLILYSAVNKFFRKNRVYAPKLISKYFEEGLMEIEDLGKETLLHHVKKSRNKLNFYKKCIDIIITIQKIRPIKKIKYSSNKYFMLESYSLKNLHKESDLFFDWYLKGVLKKKFSNKYKKIIRKELNKLYKKIFFKNNFIVHRDFHISNIMLKNKRLGVIDTQDVILGNPMYDVASLIDDIRLKVPNHIKEKTFKYYLKNCLIKNKKKSDLKNDFDILSVQRNLKILGIFYRLWKRDGKPKYLKYLPYTWKMIELRIKNKVFKDLKKVLFKAVNKKNRKKIFK